MSERRKSLEAPARCKAFLARIDGRFEVGFWPGSERWRWAKLDAKTWPAARKQAPRALRGLDLEGFAEGLVYTSSKS